MFQVQSTQINNYGKSNDAIKKAFLGYCTSLNRIDLSKNLAEFSFLPSQNQKLMLVGKSSLVSLVSKDVSFLNKICKYIWPNKNVGVKIMEYSQEGLLVDRTPDEVSQVAKKTKNSKYSIDKFVNASCNENAFNVIKQLSLGDGTVIMSGSVVCIEGEHGNGKTHLLKALHLELGNLLKKTYFKTADEFTEEYVNAYKTNVLFDYKKRVFNTQYLIIDDVEKLVSRKATFNFLLDAIKNITSNEGYVVLSSSNFSNLKELINPDILVKTTHPSEELVSKYVKQQIKISSLNIPINIADFLASEMEYSSISDVQSFIKRLVAFQGIRNMEIDVNSAREILQPLLKKQIKKVDSHEIFFNAILEYYKLTPDVFFRNKYNKCCIKVRCILIYLLHEELKCGSQFITDFLGYKNTSSVNTAIKTTIATIEKDNKFYSEVMSVKGYCNKYLHSKLNN